MLVKIVNASEIHQTLDANFVFSLLIGRHPRVPPPAPVLSREELLSTSTLPSDLLDRKDQASISLVVHRHLLISRPGSDRVYRMCCMQS